MNKNKLYSILLGITIICYSCNAFKNTETAIIPKLDIAQTFNATMETNELKVREGEYFEITLDSNPSTGFAWELVEGMDESFLEPTDNVYGSNNSDERQPSVGVGGREVWTFKALKKGNTMFSMKYCQPFDRNNPAEEKSFNIIIE